MSAASSLHYIYRPSAVPRPCTECHPRCVRGDRRTVLASRYKSRELLNSDGLVGTATSGAASRYRPCCGHCSCATQRHWQWVCSTLPAAAGEGRLRSNRRAATLRGVRSAPPGRPAQRELHGGVRSLLCAFREIWTNLQLVSVLFGWCSRPSFTGTDLSRSTASTRLRLCLVPAHRQAARRGALGIREAGR